MSKMNSAKIVAGGLVAGFVMNAIDAATNAMFLARQWDIAALILNIDMQTIGPLSTIGWVTVDFLVGISLVWLYASIRPRFGAGPKTAVLAGLAVWFITRLMFSSYVFMGVFPLSLIAASSLGSFVAAVVGALAGCALYSEE